MEFPWPTFCFTKLDVALDAVIAECKARELVETGRVLCISDSKRRSVLEKTEKQIYQQPIVLLWKKVPNLYTYATISSPPKSMTGFP